MGAAASGCWQTAGQSSVSTCGSELRAGRKSPDPAGGAAGGSRGWTTDPWGGRRAGLSASTEVDREDFGLTGNTAIEGGGVLVGKKARLEFEIEAVKQG